MITEIYKKRGMVAACALAMTAFGGVAYAQSMTPGDRTETPAYSNASSPEKWEAAATKHVSDAQNVVDRLESDSSSRIKYLLDHARGVLLVPNYGRAALGIGGSGGAGVLLVKQTDGTWSDPAFYNMGGLSVGVQLGVESGPIALILNNEKAVSKFMQTNAFSLSADAGLTVINLSKEAQASAGTGDVAVWAGTKGLFGNVVTVGFNNIRFNRNETTAYYHQTVAASDVLSGKVRNLQATTIKQALAASPTATSSGGTTGSGMTGGASENR